MRISKKTIFPVAALCVLAASSYGITQVSAASSTGTDKQASLIQKLADALHVDKSKVQAVFDQDKTDRQAARETTYEARLNQAVTDGKLTSAQKDKVLAEHNKLEAELKAAASTTGTDRRAAMEKTRTEGQTWATQNGIDAKWLIGGGHDGLGGHGHGGFGGHGPRANDNDSDDTATPSPTPSPAG